MVIIQQGRRYVNIAAFLRHGADMNVNISQLIAPVYYEAHRDLKAGGHDVYWIKGGRGSAKSAFLSFEIIFGMLRDENANALVLRRFGNKVKDSVFSQIIWALGMLGIADQFITRASPYELIRKGTGQRILFRGTDDPLKLKSIKLTKGYFKYLWCEELAEFRGLEDVRSVEQSVFRGVDRAFTLFSYNPPKSANAWVNAEALKAAKNRFTLTTCYTDLPQDWLGERFLADAEELKKTNELAYRNEYLGEITGSGGNVFENVELRPISDEEIKTFGYTYMGMDFGWYPDPTVWVKLSYDAARHTVYVFDELRAWKKPTYDLFLELRESKGLNAEGEIIADSADPKAINDLRAYGLSVTGAMKGPGTVRMSTRWLQARARIVIDDKRCPVTAKEFVSYEYERTRDGQLIDGYPDRDNHAIDAVRYALNRVWNIKGA